MMYLLRKIFIITLFLFPLGEVTRIDFGNGFAIRPLDIGIGILAALWLMFKLVKNRKISEKHICAPILFFAGSGALSLLINYHNLSINQFFISLMYLVRWIAYAGVFFAVSDFDKKFKEKITKLLIIIGSVILGLGYIQYFYYSNLRNIIYLGWDEHMYRMFSVFLDPNFAGAFFVLFFLFLINEFLQKKSFMMGFLSALTLGAVFLTFSRSALIMLILSSGLFFILVNKKMLIVYMLMVVFIALSISSRYFNIENINLFRIASSEARIDSAKNALTIIKSNLLTGVGFNSYRYAQIRYGIRKEQSAGTISHADAGTDNSFLFVLATTGFVGLILYLFMWFKIFKIASALAIVSIFGVFIDSLFINSLFYPFVMLWLWIILALKKNN